MRARALLTTLAATLLAACQHKVVAYGQVDESVVLDLVSEVSRVRQLWPRRPVRIRLQPARALRDEVERSLRDDVASGAITRRARAWGKIGLIPWEFDLVEWERRTFTDEPAGYYKPAENRLYIVDRSAFRSDLGEVWGAIVGRDPVYGEPLAHELAHAIVDQHHDLDRLVADDRSTDVLLARRALAEGDATKVGFEWGGGGDFRGHLEKIRERFGAVRADSEPGTPEWMTSQVMLPYVAGGLLVERLHSAGGWRAVDRAYDEPPASTEQLLHLDRYPADAPTKVEIPERPLGEQSGRRILEDTLGELGMRCVLRRHLPRARADAAVDGWDGDAVGVWETSDGLLLLWRSVWDSEHDATEWAEAYVQLVVDSYGDVRRRAAPEGATIFTTSEGLVGIERRGTQVLVYEGVPETRLEEVRSAARPPARHENEAIARIGAQTARPAR